MIFVNIVFFSVEACFVRDLFDVTIRFFFLLLFKRKKLNKTSYNEIEYLTGNLQSYSDCS